MLGMGLSILGALVALALALIGQSPDLSRRLGIGGARLDLRVRTFTTYAFALLVLAIGFFVAGFPIDSQTVGPQMTDSVVDLNGTAEANLASTITEVGVDETTVSAEPTQSGAARPETGSFSGPPLSDSAARPDSESELTQESGAANESFNGDEPVATESAEINTPRATRTPTETPSPSPTPLPSPTGTPTPISGETALVASGGSTVWITRSPGGQNLTLVMDGDIVLVLPGHANQAGVLWREIRTVDGLHGWIREDYIEYPD